MSLKENNDNTVSLMLDTPIPLLILKMSIPTIFTMIVLSVYSMSDMFFVSRLGTSVSAAVGIVFSILTMVQAVGSMLGIGGGSIISRNLGAGESSKADLVASVTFFSSIFFGLCLMILGILYKTELMKFLGATQTILPFAEDFAHYILIAAPIMCTAFVLNNLLRAQGKPKLSMIGLSIGGVVNIVLDPILIFGFKMGITGAAIATLIGQCVSLLILLVMYLSNKNLSKIRFSFFVSNLKILSSICITGSPSLLRQGLVVIANVLLNIHASKYGDSAVAGISITNRIFVLAISVMFGLGQGFQSVAGFSYGAKKFKRLKDAFSFTLAISVFIQVILGFLLYRFDNQIVSLFQKDVDVIKVGTQAIRFFTFSLPLLPIAILTNMLYQVTGHNKQSLFLASCRQGIFFLPLIFTLPYFFGLTGLELCQPISNIISALVAIPFSIAFFRIYR